MFKSIFAYLKYNINQYLTNVLACRTTKLLTLQYPLLNQSIYLVAIQSILKSYHISKDEEGEETITN